MYADLRRSALGTRSWITQELAGKCVLRRTIERLQKAQRVHEIIVFCPADQQDHIQKLLVDTSAIIHSLNEPVPVSKQLPRRKWALSSWRGGIHEATVFDEQSFTSEMVQFARERNIYTALAVPAEAIFIDPEMLDGFIEHHHLCGEHMRFTFSQAAPGLLCCAYRLDLLHEMVMTSLPFGEILAYNPDHAHPDFIIHESTYMLDAALSDWQFRTLADNRRSFNVFEKIFQNATDDPANWDAQQIIAAIDEYRDETDMLPIELEIEINTEPSLRINGYPHRRPAKQRGPMNLAQFEKIVNQCATYDDICMTIGGFGEPLAHPELIGMIHAAKDAGIFGINVETDGVALNDELSDSLIDSPADVLSVYLDANSKELYQEVKGQDCFELVQDQLESFIEKSKSNGRSGPLLAPHLVKTRATMPEMEEFYDRWLRRGAAAVIVGYNDFAGAIADLAVMDMAPPGRQPCRRLFENMSILADGSVTICPQDFTGQCIIGNAFETPLTELWQAQALQQVRQSHQEGNFQITDLCGACKEWHR